MRQKFSMATIVTTGLIFAAGAYAANNPPPGSVEQSARPAVPQKPQSPPLHLSDAQHAKIQEALRAENTDVEFHSKATKATKDFAPSVGAKLPAAIKPHALPRPLVYELPTLRNYTYVKFKDQILIVDAMTGKIVDMIPQG